MDPVRSLGTHSDSPVTQVKHNATSDELVLKNIFEITVDLGLLLQCRDILIWPDCWYYGIKLCPETPLFMLSSNIPYSLKTKTTIILHFLPTQTKEDFFFLASAKIWETERVCLRPCRHSCATHQQKVCA